MTPPAQGPAQDVADYLAHGYLGFVCLLLQSFEVGTLQVDHEANSILKQRGPPGTGTRTTPTASGFLCCHAVSIPDPLMIIAALFIGVYFIFKILINYFKVKQN